MHFISYALECRFEGMIEDNPLSLDEDLMSKDLDLTIMEEILFDSKGEDYMRSDGDDIEKHLKCCHFHSTFTTSIQHSMPLIRLVRDGEDIAFIRE